MTKEHWQFDKRVPLALITTILLQSVGAVWFAAKLDGRVEVLERDVLSSIAKNEQQERSIHQIETGAARLAAKLDGILVAIERVDRRLERIVEE
ncbi:MAG: hypothetical protein ABJO67_16275 [Pseudoruegeria sp.]